MENGPGDPFPFSRRIVTRLEWGLQPLGTKHSCAYRQRLEPPLQPGVQNPFVLPAVALWLAELEEAGWAFFSFRKENGALHWNIGATLALRDLFVCRGMLRLRWSGPRCWLIFEKGALRCRLKPV